MTHVVLLGDSIFDNAAYVRGGPDVVRQLRERLSGDASATLLAVDGAVIDDVARQIPRIPAGATHLVLSVGGNDALGHADLLTRHARSSAEVLEWLVDAIEPFERSYAMLLDALLTRGRPLVACTIYDGNLDRSQQRAARGALAVFNDAIQGEARRRDVPVIELRHVCTVPGDYANPIEPSVQGGAKIADAIVRQLGLDWTSPSHGDMLPHHPLVPASATMPESPAPPLARVLESAIYVDDLSRARGFYVDVLGAAVLLDTPRLLALDVGGTSVLLLFQRGATTEPLPTTGGVVPPHGASGPQHLAFAVGADTLDAWRARLGRVGIAIESEVTWPRGGRSIYVRDPDGHSIELVTPGLWATY